MVCFTGRAVSMLSSRPKLQILPQHARSTSVSSAVRGPTHARLRSLHLPKLTGRQSDEAHRSAAAARCASPTTLAEHEARSKMPTRATHQDELIALSLLKSRKAVPPPEQREPSQTASSMPVYDDFGIRRSKGGTNAASGAAAVEVNAGERPPPEIDYLSSLLLPRLVPTLKIGADTRIAPKDASLSRRRSMPLPNLSSTPEQEGPVECTPSTRRLTSARQNSLPTLLFTPPPPSSSHGDETEPRARQSADAADSPDSFGRRPARPASLDTISTESSVSGFIFLADSTRSSETWTEEGDDPRTGTIHCATLRPISRASSTSFYGPALPARHVPTCSLDTATTFSSSSESSLIFPERLGSGGKQL